MRIDIVAVGRLRDPALRTLVARYRERLPWRIREIELTPAEGPPELRRRREGERLLAHSRGRRRLVLDPRGEALDSPVFARLLARGDGPVAFLIGGAEGLDDKVRAAAERILAFGPMIWPHELVRVMLMEQIYRAWAILAGHPYHRDGDGPSTSTAGAVSSATHTR